MIWVSGFLSGRTESTNDDQSIYPMELPGFCSEKKPYTVVGGGAWGWGLVISPSSSTQEVLAWGFNSAVVFGSALQLDSPTLEHMENPITIPTPSIIHTAACGFGHCLLVSVEGKCFCIDPSADDAIHHLLVPISLSIPIRKVAAGESHSLLLTEIGDVYSFGKNTEGQLGQPDDLDPRPLRTPILVLGPSHTTHIRPELQSVVVESIAAGGRHSAATTKEGLCITWGANAHGQCGNGDWAPAQSTPVIVEELGPIKCINVACGNAHTLCLSSEGDVYSFGENSSLQLTGDAKSAGKSSSVPVLVDDVLLEDKTVVKVAAGARHSVALCSTGESFGWGSSKYGQLMPLLASEKSEKRIGCAVHKLQTPDGKKILDVAVGWWHTILVTADDDDTVL